MAHTHRSGNAISSAKKAVVTSHRSARARPSRMLTLGPQALGHRPGVSLIASRPADTSVTACCTGQQCPGWLQTWLRKPLVIPMQRSPSRLLCALRKTREPHGRKRSHGCWCHPAQCARADQRPQRLNCLDNHVHWRKRSTEDDMGTWCEPAIGSPRENKRRRLICAPRAPWLLGQISARLPAEGVPSSLHYGGFRSQDR